MTLQQLGDALGMSKQAASKHVKRGMPTESTEAARDWYKRNKNPAQRKRQPDTPAVDVVDALAWPEPEAEHKARRSSQRAALAPIRVANDESFEQARTRKEIAIADQAEMDADKQRGILIEIDKVRAEYARQIKPIAEGLLNIPARLAPVLHAANSLGEVQTLLDTEIRVVLAQLVGEP